MRQSRDQGAKGLRGGGGGKAVGGPKGGRGARGGRGAQGAQGGREGRPKGARGHNATMDGIKGRGKVTGRKRKEPGQQTLDSWITEREGFTNVEPKGRVQISTKISTESDGKSSNLGALDRHETTPPTVDQVTD